ncbi:MAG: hypothetical protein HRU18_00720 [Pseudoalteromonas sp.]|uniref:hypothetical protein n=1 Tax=Pseudoalteromonas sp. TaxID=53249 RepID=UPI001DB87AB0|nr:hypothetical protein [Pseudoalteromonas sp.]NRA76702.1 hypothetical protein [Pseudoalteromonas sp.]
MSGEKIRQIADVVASHPKTATVAVAALTNFNVWLADYEPVVKFATSILGIVLVSVLIIKHTIDLVKSIKND